MTVKKKTASVRPGHKRDRNRSNKQNTNSQFHDGAIPERANINHDDPLLEESRFDEEFYIECFSDVADALRLNQFPSGYYHYVTYGYAEMIEGRRRSVSLALGSREPADELTARKADDRRFDEIGDDFFEELYIECYPDIARMIDGSAVTSSRDRWRLYRDAELKAGHAPIAKFRAIEQSSEPTRRYSRTKDIEGFDSVAYLLLYPDVRDAMGGSTTGALDHWLGHGFSEGRIGPGIQTRPRRYLDFSAFYSRPLGINVYGPFEATSGLGTAARAMAKAVRASGIPYDLWMFKDIGSGILPAAHHTGRTPKYRVNLILANPGVLRHVFEAYSPNHFGDAYNIVIWQWELASFRPDWIFETEGIDEIWTNSQFQVEAISAIVKCPVINIPLPVSAPAKPAADLRDFYSIPRTAFVFLNIFDIGSTIERKNPIAVIEAFQRLIDSHKNIHLILKHHGGTGTPDAQSDLRKALRGLDHVTVISDKLDINGMDRLRATCDCLISAHRGEGFGLNIAEFMSLGKSVIATMYSGNVDFFNGRVGYPIDYRLVELEKYIGPYQKGFVWADPCPDSILTQMKNVIADPKQRQRKSVAAAESVKSALSIDAVGKAISRRMDDLGLADAAPTFLRNLGSTTTAIRNLTQKPMRHESPALLLPYQPLISVVIPVYNVSDHYLLECVGSIVDQTYPFWELCLCDDGSTNIGTLAALQRLRGSDFRIKIVSMPKNAGISAATNRAIEIATGPFVALLDNDDIIRRNALEEIVIALNDNPDLDVIYTDEDKIGPNGNHIDHFCKPDWSPEHLKSVMYRTAHARSSKIPAPPTRWIPWNL